MSPFSLMTFNVQAFESSPPSAVARFIDETIAQVGHLDVIAVQENIVTHSGDSHLQLAGYTAHTARAERYGTNYLGNTTFVHNTGASRLLGVLPTKFGSVDRSAVVVQYNGRRIANTHLTGGRFDDRGFDRYVDAKSREIHNIVSQYEPDLIVGDFNADTVQHADRVGQALVSGYTSLPQSTRVAFRSYYGDVHTRLQQWGYRACNPTAPPYQTSVYGGTVDWIYQRAPLSPDVTCCVDAIGPRISDHNAVVAMWTR